MVPLGLTACYCVYMAVGISVIHADKELTSCCMKFEGTSITSYPLSDALKKCVKNHA